jgi:hypothetical protein
VLIVKRYGDDAIQRKSNEIAALQQQLRELWGSFLIKP